MNRNRIENGFWQQNVTSHSISAWRGFAFENVCFNHINQIKNALNILGVYSQQYAWIKRDSEEGTQIDLIIERNDNIVNMCEIKFYSDEFVVKEDYDRLLRSRRSILAEKIKKKYVIHSTLISTYGIKNNEYRWSFDSVITLDDLFVDA